MRHVSVPSCGYPRIIAVSDCPQRLIRIINVATRYPITNVSVASYGATSDKSIMPLGNKDRALGAIVKADPCKLAAGARITVYGTPTVPVIFIGGAPRVITSIFRVVPYDDPSRNTGVRIGAP